MSSRVFLIGSRYTSEKIRPLLSTAIEKHITEYGANAFYVGHRGNFDRICFGVFKGIKRKIPKYQVVSSRAVCTFTAKN